MASPASNLFKLARGRARLFSSLAHAPKLRPITHLHRSTCLHAALATYVAGWEAYLEDVTRQSIALLRDPSNLRVSSLIQVLEPHALRAIEKFNTPNHEQSRNLLLNYLGYDPWPDWTWPQRSMGSPQVQLRLNEILRVRHSFPLPNDIPWVVRRGKPGELTVGAVHEQGRLLEHLVTMTDSGLSAHLSSRFGATVSW